jgi:hypothetical protein
MLPALDPERFTLAFMDYRGYRASSDLSGPYDLATIAHLQTRLAAVGLAIFTLATALMFHANWSQPPQLVNFMKNVAMIGGLAQVVAFGAGPLSLDGWRARRRAAGGDG